VSPGFVSRDYRIEQAPLGEGTDASVLSLIGGKWTTFRASAEHIADRVLGLLARSRVRSTKGLAIGGGRGYPTTERARRQWITGHPTVSGARASVLLDRYGTVAADVIRAIAGDPADAPLAAAHTYSTGELRHLARTEHVVHLDDVLMRRTSIAFTGGATPAAAAEIAEAIAPVLGWDAARQAFEVERGLAKVNAYTPAAPSRHDEVSGTDGGGSLTGPIPLSR
jgi:glycerol-3-phosphate dehydrogenase